MSAATVIPVSLRTFTPGDRFVLNRWLNEPHVAAWFGSRAIADAEIAIAQSSPSALVSIIELNGTAAGYLHAFDAAMLGGVRPRAMADGCMVMTALIGVSAYRGQGYGAAALALARAEVFATSLVHTVAVQVPLKNEAAVRALERHGFAWRQIWRDSVLGPCWIMTATRA